MAKNYYDITLALAGVCQAARLVQQLAHQGHCDSDALHVSLNSIIDLDPESTLAGIRAAVLWHQVGGGRLQLMFSRNRLVNQAKQILAHLTPEL